MNSIKSINEFEQSKFYRPVINGFNPINIEKLIEYATAIKIVCAGEYGITYYNEEERHVYICLGDSHPFDTKDLREFILEYINKDWKFRDHIKITIENECYPSGDDWKKVG